MIKLDNTPGRSFFYKGLEYLYFSGTSYLGIKNCSTFQQYLVEGLKKYGNNLGGSRLSNLQLDIFDKVESYLANFCQAESALSVSSGTLAAQLVLNFLQGKGVYLQAPNVHASLFLKNSGKALSSFEQWVDIVKNEATKEAKPLIILSNSVNPLKVKKYNFNWISELDANRKIFLILDDSHYFGISGPGGSGSHPGIDSPKNVELVVLGSLGKAFGLPAGLILASNPIIKQIKRQPLFGGASPAAPAYLYAFLKAEKLYRDRRKKLFENIDHFCKLIRLHKRESDFRYIDGYPVFYCENKNWHSALLERRIFISNFPYPSPDSEPVSRIILNSLHSFSDIEYLFETILNL